MALEQRLVELAQQGYLGVNVTAPLKLACAEFIAQTGMDLPASGSVNTVRFRAQQIDGVANTDIAGFDFLLGSSRPRSVGVLGAGGVVPSVLSVLQQRQVSDVVVYNRSSPRSEYALELLASAPNWAWHGIEDLSVMIGAHDVVIHALPIQARAWSIGFDWRHLKNN